MYVMSKSNKENSTDEILNEIEDYVINGEIDSEEAYSKAHYVLIDSLGCGNLALEYPECTKLLGTIVHGTYVPYGVLDQGPTNVLEPFTGAYNTGTMLK